MKSCRIAVLFAFLFSLFTPVLAEELVVRYHRPDGDYDNWTLWTWAPGAEGREIRSSAREPYGLVFRFDVPAGADRVGMVPKFRNWDGKDDPDRFWTSSDGREVFILQADKRVFSSQPDLSPRVVSARVDAPDRISLLLSRSTDASAISASAVTVVDGRGNRLPVASAVPGGSGRVKLVNVTLASPLPDGEYSAGTAAIGEYRAAEIRPGRIVDSYFDGRPLGALYRPEFTVFRTFAPTASSVEVLLWNTPEGGEALALPMTNMGQGIWQTRVAEDLRNRYYKYRSTVPEGVFEVIDPYSPCNTAHNGRGMIVSENSPIAPGPDFPQSDAIIYEVHLRDFSIDPAGNFVYRGKYLGMTEEGRTLAGEPGVAVGLDHLKELGVNTIQILPFQDFDNNEASDGYNWGYMPFHFNSPDGWYATRRDDATRVREVRALVDALHRAGFKVVMDVVYNHTAEGNPEVRMSFNGLAPNYYYRVKEDGSYSNGSGCGNEFRSESPMGRKFIVDSLLYWVTNYDIDGFRFDLMGLIDLATIKALVEAVHAVKPHAFIYGEPWAGGNTPIRVTSKGDQRGENFGVFNDHFRDGLRGSAFSRDPGFIQVGRDVARVKKGILGSISDFALQPWESINYIEAHDNHTLIDRIALTLRNRPDVSEADYRRIDKLGAAIVLTSQGVPFLHAGQEMLRTKNGEDNSYNKPDEVNQIHWRWKRENRDVFDYYRGLIALRKAHPMFRLKTADEVRRSIFFLDDDMGLPVPGSGIGYILSRGNSGDGWQNALVLFNALASPSEFTVPASNWTPVVNADRAGVEPLGPPLAGTRVVVPERSALVFYNEDPTFFARVLEPRLAAKAARRQTFTVEAPGATRVTIAGSFNGWNNSQHALTRGADGKWTITLELDPGVYEYKFLQDGDWDKLNSANRTVRVP